MNKEIWKKILNIAITILTAIATTFGVSSCMGKGLHSAFQSKLPQFCIGDVFLFGLVVDIE